MNDSMVEIAIVKSMAVEILGLNDIGWYIIDNIGGDVLKDKINAMTIEELKNLKSKVRQSNFYSIVNLIDEILPDNRIKIRYIKLKKLVALNLSKLELISDDIEL